MEEADEAIDGPLVAGRGRRVHKQLPVEHLVAQPIFGQVKEIVEVVRMGSVRSPDHQAKATNTRPPWRRLTRKEATCRLVATGHGLPPAVSHEEGGQRIVHSP